MIFKEFGLETEKQIKTLKKLLRQSNSDSQKKLIKQDLMKLESGYISEKENAYYLDFHLGASENHILLHNIRIEHKNRTAQIDHILINRFGVTLLESKGFKGVLEIKQDGSMMVSYGKTVKTYPNPIEQNNRHMLVVEELINEQFDLPVNIKAFGGIKFYTKVLINPKTSIKNDTLPKGYERADKFATSRLEEIDKMDPISVLKVASTMLTIQKAKELANFLLEHDKPLIFDYSKKYRIKSDQSSFVKEDNIPYGKQNSISKDIDNTLYRCPKCNSKSLKILFGRNYYFKCLDCDNNIPIKHNCNTSKCRPKTKKKGLNFFKVCEKCNIEQYFYTNPS